MFTFNNTKYFLIFLNSMYFIAGAGLLYICVNAKYQNPPIEFISDEKFVIVCEIVTLFLAVIGTYAVFRHHQVIMFFYIIILLFVLFIEADFSFEVLKISDEDKAEQVWNQMNPSDQIQFMDDNRCYPYGSHMNFSDIPASIRVPCFSEVVDCEPCSKKLASILLWWNKLIGLWGLGCCIAKVPGVFLTRHYRNLKDPRSHASAFL